MANKITDELINDTIELAKEIQQPNKDYGSNPFSDRIAPLLDAPESKNFLIKLMDVAFRSNNFDRISNYIFDLFNSTNAHKNVFSPSESILVRLYRIIGHKFPSVSIPLMLNQIQEVTSPVIFFNGSTKFKEHALKRKKHGITLNINPIGETLIGEFEAKERINKYIEFLHDEDVNYLSIKLSTIHSQIHAISYDEVVEECVLRLSKLYHEILKIREYTGIEKFINLDMEEYRDLSITLQTFKRTLNKPEFKTIRAGIVLQAYLPDTFKEAIKLRDWAKERVKNGGAPVKVRIVKGANLEMEKTEASIHGWPLATYSNKLDTDANYKKILLELLVPSSAASLNVGVASHNIFDLAFCLNLTLKNNLQKHVDFEMLEGMAKSTAIEINKKGVQLILYTPIVGKENYLNAIAYLVRRLDEGTQDGNFLKEGFNLDVDSKKWIFLKNQFLESIKMISYVQIESNRRQNRLSEKYEIKDEFENCPDTDWTSELNREWIRKIRKKWLNTPSISVIPVVGTNHKNNRSKIYQNNWRKQLPWEYELATKEDFENAIQGTSSWCTTTPHKRYTLLKEAAKNIANKRADLIGMAVTELGKLPEEVDIEVSEAIDFANYYAESIIDLQREKVEYKCSGINLVLSPWNFPIAIPIGGVLASLAAGKRVVLKPSQNAAATAYLISTCLWDAGIPKEAFYFLPSQEKTLDNFLSSGNIFDAVILTGGNETAQFLLQRNPYLNLYAETGGKNATIVTALADKEQAIANVINSAFGNSGQKCSATSLLILEKEVFENKEFKSLLKDAAESKKVGSPWDFETKIGPMAVPINDRIKYVLNNTKDKDWLLKPEIKGKQILSPGIKWGIAKGDFEYHNELFGPILCVMKADNLDYAIELVNGTKFGLTSGIESLSKEEVNYWKNKMKAGNLYANRSTTGAIVQRQPFGGIKASSFGFGMKAGGPNYVRQFINYKPNEISNSRIKNDFKAIYQNHFKKEIDYSKIRGQHNILRYQKAKNAIILIDEKTKKEDLEIVLLSCKVVNLPFVIFSTHENHELNHKKININALNNLLREIEEDTVLRSLIKHLPEPFMKECHKKNIHVYNRTPCANGRFELLNYFKEQSLSINFHRYGNLMGEKNL
ncbi:MAG: proline dehydrogenase family protein [Flavobacteriales bacterium]